MLLGSLMPDNGWRDRLRKALGNRSMRSVSLKAGLGPSYVHEILKTTKDPSIVNLQKICEVLGVSFTYISVGVVLSPEQERLAQIYLSLSEADRELFLRMAERFEQKPD